MAYRKFFLGFPSLKGRPCQVPALQLELNRLEPSKRLELQKQLLEARFDAFRCLSRPVGQDFRWRFMCFQSYLTKRKRDVQEVLRKEWMPLELRRAFGAFDLCPGGQQAVLRGSRLCMKSEWLTREPQELQSAMKRRPPGRSGASPAPATAGCGPAPGCVATQS